VDATCAAPLNATPRATITCSGIQPTNSVLYAVGEGWTQPLKLIAMSFPLSFVFAALLHYVLKAAGPVRYAWGELAALPITVAVVLVLILDR
jgi:hypothetical protein